MSRVHERDYMEIEVQRAQTRLVVKILNPEFSVGE